MFCIINIPKDNDDQQPPYHQGSNLTDLKGKVKKERQRENGMKEKIVSLSTNLYLHTYPYISFFLLVDQQCLLFSLICPDSVPFSNH